MSQRCWVRFARLALRVAEQSLPAYAHKFSPQRYRLAQLAACVCLKQYLRLDWRGIEQLLQLSPPLSQALELARVPDHTTLCRFAARWLGAPTLGRCWRSCWSAAGCARPMWQWIPRAWRPTPRACTLRRAAARTDAKRIRSLASVW